MLYIYIILTSTCCLEAAWLLAKQALLDLNCVLSVPTKCFVLLLT